MFGCNKCSKCAHKSAHTAAHASLSRCHENTLSLPLSLSLSPSLNARLSSSMQLLLPQNNSYKLCPRRRLRRRRLRAAAPLICALNDVIIFILTAPSKLHILLLLLRSRRSAGVAAAPVGGGAGGCWVREWVRERKREGARREREREGARCSALSLAPAELGLRLRLFAFVLFARVCRPRRCCCRSLPCYLCWWLRLLGVQSAARAPHVHSVDGRRCAWTYDGWSEPESSGHTGTLYLERHSTRATNKQTRNKVQHTVPGK